MTGATGGSTTPGSPAGHGLRSVVAELQQALLPTALPVLPEAAIAARYLVAGHDRAAGGDWFDAITLPDGRVALAVGDVVGHGVAATAAMGQLRAVLNELLLAEPGLDVVLKRIDAFAARTPALRAATLALAVLDPAEGGLEYATCGHPPLLVITGSRTRYLPSAPSGPLGTGRPPASARDRLARTDLLLLYSDGLVERPGWSLASGLAELAAVASKATASAPLPAAGHQSTAERVCQLTVERLARAAGYADDVTTLAVERLARRLPEVHLTLPAAADSLTVIRRAIRDWMAEARPADDDQDGVHMAVVEVATNAIEHAYAGEPGLIDFDLALRPDGQLECVVSDYGSWQAPDPAAADRGNGLMVAGQMIDRMTISHPADADDAARGAPSTMVRLVHQLSRPAALVREATPDAGPGPARPRFGVQAMLTAGTAVARVRGPVDIATADEFLRRVLAACRGGTLPLMLDLTTVSFLASAGVSALFRLSDQIGRHQNRLQIVAGRGSHVADVLQIVGLSFSESPPVRTSA